jgi:HK97 family phage major capsid protein
VDLSQYLFVDKGGIQSASSIHIKFDYAETAFRWIYRADGQPTWQSALTPFKGSNTVSPYIALNTRS